SRYCVVLMSSSAKPSMATPSSTRQVMRLACNSIAALPRSLQPIAQGLPCDLSSPSPAAGAASGPEGQEIGLAQEQPEVFQVHGLDEVDVEPGLLGAPPVLFLAVSGHRHQHRLLQVLVLPAPSGHPL